MDWVPVRGVKMFADVLLIAGAYLYGSIPFVWGIAHLKGINLRYHGSQNIGGGNLIKVVGVLPGFIGSVCDFSKGIVPLVVGYYWLDANLYVLCMAAIAALVGQMWSVWTGFYGGRGTSVSGGLVIIFFSLSFISWEVLLAFIPLFIAIIARNTKKVKKAPTRIVPLGTLLTFALIPILTWLLHEPPVITITFSTVLLLLVIRRLTADIIDDLRYKAEKQRIRDILINRLLYDRSDLISILNSKRGISYDR